MRLLQPEKALVTTGRVPRGLASWPKGGAPQGSPGSPTDVAHGEALPLPEDEAGRVRVELDGQIGRGGVELLGPAAAQELAQDVAVEVIPIIDREDVTLAQVQAAGREEGSGKGLAGSSGPLHVAQGAPAEICGDLLGSAAASNFSPLPPPWLERGGGGSWPRLPGVPEKLIIKMAAPFPDR